MSPGQAVTHLRLWSNRLRSGAQTGNLQWQAQRPEEKHAHVVSIKDKDLETLIFSLEFWS